MNKKKKKKKATHSSEQDDRTRPSSHVIHDDEGSASTRSKPPLGGRLMVRAGWLNVDVHVDMLHTLLLSASWSYLAKSVLGGGGAIELRIS